MVMTKLKILIKGKIRTWEVSETGIINSAEPSEFQDLEGCRIESPSPLRTGVEPIIQTNGGPLKQVQSKILELI